MRAFGEVLLSFLFPFDRVEVDPVLGHLPERAEGTQGLDGLNHFGDRGLDLSLCGKAPQAEPQGRLDDQFVGAHCSQDIRRLQCGGGARRACGYADCFQSHSQALALDVGEAHVDDVGDLEAWVAVKVGEGDAAEAFNEALAEAGDAGAFSGTFLLDDLAGDSESYAKRHGQRPPSYTFLLASSGQERAQLKARLASDIEGTDAFGAIEFVGGKACQGYVPALQVKRHLAQGLGGVGVEGDGEALAERADFIHGLDDAGFVVDGGDGD